MPWLPSPVGLKHIPSGMCPVNKALRTTRFRSDGTADGSIRPEPALASLAPPWQAWRERCPHALVATVVCPRHPRCFGTGPGRAGQRRAGRHGAARSERTADGRSAAASGRADGGVSPGRVCADLLSCLLVLRPGFFHPVPAAGAPPILDTGPDATADRAPLRSIGTASGRKWW